MSEQYDPHAGWIRVYRDVSREYRFQRVASNGQVVSVSGEGFKRKRHAVRMARQLFGHSVPLRVDAR